jgi:hypothetical protein
MSTDTEQQTSPLKKPRGRPPVKNPEKLAIYNAQMEAYRAANPEEIGENISE